MEDKVKHRIVGGFVLLALLVIFIPIAFKNQSPIDRSISKHKFQAPPTPVQKRVSAPAFNPHPVGHVDLQSTVAEKSALPTNMAVKQQPSAKHQATVEKKKQTSEATATKPAVAKKPALAAETVQHNHDVSQQSKRHIANTPKAWVIQLASFSDMTNAKSLETSLQKKGYAAFTSSSNNSKGVKISRVMVGPEIKRESAEKIQSKLAQSTHIKGFVVEFDPRVKTA